jgi:methionine-rich copper-binding protein CopC
MRSFPRWLGAGLSIFVLLVIALPGVALAHAERQSSRPDEGTELRRPPLHLYVNFSEPPTGDSTVTVLDGCGNAVVADFEVTDRTIHANLDPGQPGTWRVRTQVVSGLDGHPTRDRWSFEVDGTRDCAAPPPPADDTEEPDEEVGGGVGGAVLLAAGAAVVLIGMAAAIRLRSK